MAVGIPNLGDVEDVLQPSRNRIGGEHISGPATSRTGRVDRASIEIRIESPSTRHKTKRLCSARLLTIALVPPRNPRAVDAGHEGSARSSSDDDGAESWPRLGSCTRSPGREEPDAMAFELEPRILDGDSEPVPRPIVADEDELAARLEYSSQLAQKNE
jgi:hypothetical protein